MYNSVQYTYLFPVQRVTPWSSPSLGWSDAGPPIPGLLSTIRRPFEHETHLHLLRRPILRVPTIYILLPISQTSGESNEQ